MSNNCWNQIGVKGDRSCFQLQTLIHCRNCPVYSGAGRSLLERQAPVDYLNDWTNLLEQGKENGANSLLASTLRISVGLFRLGGEWLALPARLFKEIVPRSIIHTLPHRSNTIFLGLVNIRGEIQLCISLQAFLGLKTLETSNQQISPMVYERLVVIDQQGSRWVFPVDEVYGIHRLHPDDLENVPATVSKVPETYTKGVIHWQNQTVSYLDEELLFYSLNKKLINY
jgi:chemotaxis-related protein WspD